jgi:NAD(P)-dependent dehydrogenase (short-subunit alcohol dehydrogenase family)
MNGRIVAITGGNSGIGLETARALLAAGARVILLCRSLDRGRAAVEGLSATGGTPELVRCDLADPASITAAAAEVAARAPRLDVLINNAGAYFPRYTTTDTGLELTFAVNHLGPFWLTRLLLPLLTGPDARIVNVASRAHEQGRLRLDDLQRKRRSYFGYAAYADSKLCNILFTRALARRLPDGVTTNALHPGVIASGFGQDEPGIFGTLFRLGRPLLSTPEQGARTSIFLASAPEVAGVSGGYFVRGRPARPSRLGRDDAAAEALWAASEALCAGFTAGGVPVGSEPAME